ncbi:MAG: adenylate kinase [Caldisericia bacterium]|nr:adenylate kinase [Caldisericia bacterium]
MIILMLGNIGVGKGTQGKLIMDKYKIPYFATGDIFRENIQKNTPLGIKVKEIVSEGKLVSDELVNEIVFDKINNLDNFILDGYPRTLNQALAFENFIKEKKKDVDIVIYIDVPEDVIIKRLSGRRICPKCGKVYNIYLDKPKVNSICDLDGEKLIIRDDDRLDVIKKRIEEFKLKTYPLIEFYEKRGKLYKVDGNKSVFEVFDDISKIIDDYIEKQKRN